MNLELQKNDVETNRRMYKSVLFMKKLWKCHKSLEIW